MVNTSTQLQCIYLGISMVSSFCVITNFNIVNCSNIIGLISVGDLYFVKKKDMILHHILVLFFLDYMNIHDDFKYKNEIVSTLLSSEISTIFLTTNNLLDNYGNMGVFKHINQLCFVSTFFYYRIYNYSIFFDKNIYNTFSIYSKNNFEFYKIYCVIYLFYILNLYWFSIIIYRVGEKVYNVAIKQKI